MGKVTERHKIVRELLEVMSKEELAAKVGVSTFTIVRWSRAERNPGFASFYLLKNILEESKKQKGA